MVIRSAHDAFIAIPESPGARGRGPDLATK